MNTGAVEMVMLIRTELARRGDGRGGDSVVRAITQYWTPKGELIIAHDPCAVSVTPELRAKMREAIYMELGENEKSRALWDKLLEVMQNT